MLIETAAIAGPEADSFRSFPYGIYFLTIHEKLSIVTVREQSMNSRENEISLQSVLDIGQYIRAIRKSRTMTQADLCDISGVSRRFISELENGKVTAEIGKILHVLRCIGCDMTLRVRRFPNNG